MVVDEGVEFQHQAQGVGEIDARFKNIRRTVKAGPHKVGVTYVAKTAAEHIEVLHGFNSVVGMGVHVNGNSDGPRIQNVAGFGLASAHT